MTQRNSPAPLRGTREIGVLLLPGFSNLCLANAVEPLRAVNDIHGMRSCRYHLLSVDGAAVATSSDLRIGVERSLREAAPVAAFFVIASAAYREALTPAVKAGLRRAARQSPVMAGLDTGPWLLAASGLLDGHTATIHWQAEERLRRDFPDVDVTGARYVIDRGRITAGGATAVLDLMLALVRQWFDEVTALEVMRLFLYDHERAAESDQLGALHAPFTARAPTVAAAIEVMEHAIERPLALDQVARRSNCSQRKLERAFADALGVTPQRYYNYLRLASARRMLQDGEVGVAGAAAATGFTSASAFARAYRRLFGQAPGAIRPRRSRSAW